MAGNPKKAAMKAELERRTRAEFPDEPERTWLDYVAACLADGQTFRALCRDMGVSTPMVYDALNHAFGQENVRAAFAKARELGAHQLAEEAIEISDEVMQTPAESQRASLRIRARQWTAERWNRADMGQQKAAGATINIGTLMLQALQAPIETAGSVLPPARGSSAALTIQPDAIAAAIPAPVEILSIEPASTSEPEQ